MPTVDNLDIQISSSFTTTNKQLDNLIAKLGIVTSSLSRVKGTTSAVSTGMTKVSASTNKAAKSTRSLSSAFGSFYANYFLVVRGIKSLYKSIEGTSDYIEAFNYFEVSFNKIASEWKHDYEKYGYDNAEAYADSFTERAKTSMAKLSGVQVNVDANGNGLLTETGMKNLGLNIQEITQYASQLASVTNSVGQTGEVSLATANSFTKLAGDISSLFNVDYSSVAKNLQSGLIGQSRALYKYGIDITNATLQTYAYKLGVEKSVSEMTQAEKMQLRMIAILDQSKVSWGDLANTINSPSNMIRQFKTNLKEAGMVLGQLFVPLLQKALPVVNGVTIAIKRLLGNIAGILGIKLDLDSFGQGASTLEDEYDDVSDSLDDVAESAKKARAGIRAFDELKTINMPDSSSSSTSGLGNTIDLTEEIIAATEEYEKVWQEAYNKMEQKAQAFADAIEKILKPIEKLFKDIKLGDWFAVGQDVSVIANGILNYVNDALDDVPWGEIGEKFGNLFEGSVLGSFDSLATAGKIISKAAKGIFTFLTETIKTVDYRGITKKFLSSVTEFLKNLEISETIDKITSFIVSVNNAIISVVDELMRNPDLILKLFGVLILKIFELILSTAISQQTVIAEGLSETLISIIKTALDLSRKRKETNEKIKLYLEDLFEGGANAWEQGTFKEWLGEKIKTVFNSAISTAKSTFKGSWLEEWFNKNIVTPLKNTWAPIAPWLNQIFIQPVSKAFSGFAETVGKIFQGLWIVIQAVWIKAPEWFNEYVTTPIEENFLPIIEKISEPFSEAYQNVTEKWGKAKQWFEENVTSKLEKPFKDATNTIEKVFSNMWTSIKNDAVSKMNSIIGFIERAINIIVRGANNIIKKFNSLVSWGAKVTGDSWSDIKPISEISLKRIQGYEFGGYPNKASLFWANENGIPELVGTMGGKTAVASGTEITGIKDAIYTTGQQETNLMQTMVGLLRIIAEKEFGITDDQIGKSAQRYAKNYFNRTGEEAFSF